MTVERSPGPVQFEVDHPPTGGLESVKQWAYEMFGRLVGLQAQPRVQSVMWARVESIGDPVFQRPAPGMMIYAAAGVVLTGTPEGFYVFVGGTWKQLEFA